MNDVRAVYVVMRGRRTDPWCPDRHAYVMAVYANKRLADEHASIHNKFDSRTRAWVEKWPVLWQIPAYKVEGVVYIMKGRIIGEESWVKWEEPSWVSR